MPTTDFLNKKLLSNQKGFTLVEITLSLALIAVLILIIFQLPQDTFKDIKRNQLSATRDQLAVWARQMGGSPKAFQASLKKPENVKFYNCVCGNGSAACNSAELNPFTLYDIDSAAPGAPAPQPAKVDFNADGFPCDSTSENCLLQIRYHFLGQCMPTLPSADPTPPASCTTPAEFVGIRFTVQQNPNSVSKNISIKSVTGTIFVPVSTIAPAGGGICP